MREILKHVPLSTEGIVKFNQEVYNYIEIIHGWSGDDEYTFFC